MGPEQEEVTSERKTGKGFVVDMAFKFSLGVLVRLRFVGSRRRAVGEGGYASPGVEAAKQKT